MAGHGTVEDDPLLLSNMDQPCEEPKHKPILFCLAQLPAVRKRVPTSRPRASDRDFIVRILYYETALR